MRFSGFASVALVLVSVHTAIAAPAFTCGGFASPAGAQLLCSQTDPEHPPQICTFSWTLMSTAAGQTVVSGSFFLLKGVTNAIVYQGTGYRYGLSVPIVLCQSAQADAASLDEPRRVSDSFKQ